MVRWSMRQAPLHIVCGGNQQVLWPDCYCTRWPEQPSVIDPVTNAANVRRLCASILVSNGFTCWPCTRLSTVCCKYRLDPESKKHVQQQNAAEGTRHLVLGVLPLLRSSIYPPVAVYISHNGCRRSKTNRQLPINCTSVNKLIICRCQQPSSVAVKKHHL